MGNFNYSFLELTQKNYQRTFIIQGIYNKILQILEKSKNKHLITLIECYLNEYPVYELERFFNEWFSHDDKLHWANYDIQLDISLILGFILPYYVDYTDGNFYQDLYPISEKYRLIEPLKDDSLPPSYSVHHVHCMLDMLSSKIYKSASPQSQGAFKKAQNDLENKRKRQLFKRYYLKQYHQQPNKAKIYNIDKALTEIELTYDIELNLDTASKKWINPLHKNDYFTPALQIKILNQGTKPLEHNIHIRKDLTEYINKMDKIII